MKQRGEEEEKKRIELKIRRRRRRARDVEVDVAASRETWWKMWMNKVETDVIKKLIDDTGSIKGEFSNYL